MRRLVPLALALFALFATPARIPAQETAVATPTSTPVASGLEIAPEPQADPGITAKGYFVYELAAGAEATGSIRLRNPDDEPVTVEFATVDADTAQLGGTAYSPSDIEPAAAGAWLSLDESRISLAPGEEALVHFAVQVPKETTPGQYLAGIAAFIPVEREGTPTAGDASAGASIIVQPRYVIGVEVDVPGAWTPSLTITGASALEQPSGTKLGIAIRNDGDTFLWPKGSVTLSNAEATPILSEPIELGTFITGSGITYPVAWPGVPQGGDYGVEVELRYANDKIARYRGTLTVSDDAPVAQPAPGEESRVAAPAAPPAASPIQPWMLYLIAGLLGLIALLLALLLVRSRQPRW